ncbi:MAG: putative bifunctional diguanylate cyclase/phosphodiesterase, partial [Opitutaceae bacterium]
MNLSSLSNEELTQNLHSLRRMEAEAENVSSAETEALVQELQVHRVELEMQNRALRESALEVEAAVRRYCDLYDHLPIGYVTLTRSGRIVQA